ncbi:hypothetical protein D1614_15655 [Maribellus luteus]|uniref:Uncharacterized protein n=1 Tax=Maribellus luteus TaxID=2305463 RepID=A0A399SX40_9BACT|nr:hypothetical protein [Maribellus luteus]RIJ47192.1 hypothetical protein D1614_15655 [Maribellus luteus]
MSKQLLLLSFFIAFWACATISQFDQYAYVQTTSLKVDALSVMDLATDDFDQHKDEVLQLTSGLQKIYEYEKNRPKNEITVKMWEKMLNEDDHLLGGFLLKWKTQGQQSKVFIEEAKKIIGPAFDQIAQLESKKIKPSDI